MYSDLRGTGWLVFTTNWMTPGRTTTPASQQVQRTRAFDAALRPLAATNALNANQKTT